MGERRAFKLRIRCAVCQEVVMEDGDDVDTGTEHRSLVTSAGVYCPDCGAPFVEVCVRPDGSSIARCTSHHVHGVRAVAAQGAPTRPLRTH